MEWLRVGVLLFTGLAMVASAAQDPSGWGIVSLPTKTWGVVLNLPGYRIERNEVRPDGRRYLFASNPTSGVNVSVTLEEVDSSQLAQSCEDNLKERARDQSLPRKNVRTWQADGITFLEYMVPRVQGMDLRQQNLFACLFRDGVYIDVHFSKVGFQAGDEKLFQEVLATLKFRENIERTSLDYFTAASRFYLQRSYKRSIPLYARALEIEKGQRQIEKKLWYVLVDNLGMAYGLTGDLTKAKETFEYGLSQDSTYPLFYYNLACAYAEMQDLKRAQENLKQAFEFKQNVLPGETMPNPLTDDSFKPHLKNKEFRAFLESLVRQ